MKYDWKVDLKSDEHALNAEYKGKKLKITALSDDEPDSRGYVGWIDGKKIGKAKSKGDLYKIFDTKLKESNISKVLSVLTEESTKVRLFVPGHKVSDSMGRHKLSILVKKLGASKSSSADGADYVISGKSIEEVSEAAKEAFGNLKDIIIKNI
jgi:hypothetical protein